MKHLKTSLFCSAALLGMSLSITNVAQAQRVRTEEERQAQRAERRQRFENMTPEQREQFMQQRRQERLKNMTPEQRAQMETRRAGREVQQTNARWDWVRQTLTASGFTEAATQDPIVEFMKTQETARQPLRDQAVALTALLVEPNTPDEMLKTNLATYRAAVTADTARYATELAALDTKVKYSTLPRLETLLNVLGVVGSETPMLGGVGALFPDSPMGRGGRDGGGRGGRGRGGDQGMGGG